MPSGTRISEPVSTGMAVSRPNSVELRFSVFLIGMPITPNIIQTMKQTVKARVLTISTDQDCRLTTWSFGGAGCFLCISWGSVGSFSRHQLSWLRAVRNILPWCRQRAAKGGGRRGRAIVLSNY